MRWSLFSEIVVMSWDTLRGNKMRSALTVLGIVIGITSIVGMTSLIRGFTESFHDLIKGRTRSSSRSFPL
jgi:putative ABC transport system permease protein